MKILVINSGSSSIKFELFDMPGEQRQAKGLLQRIGESASELTGTMGDTKLSVSQPVADHAKGLELIVGILTDPARGGLEDISEIGAVGHRVVHGGEAFTETVRITDEVETAIGDNAALAPLHNPPNLLGIRVARELLPDVPQVAVFDTAFHHTMPDYAYTYPIPFEFYESLGIRRYGFHGTSHRYVAQRAASMLGLELCDLNLITCHLGNGCSIAAIRGGRSMDTSMGLTPLEGLMMGTRCGDIDPALIAFLHRIQGRDVAEIDKDLNKKSGLLGVSRLSNDVRTLLEAEAAGHELAALALTMYCYRVKKYIGAYSAVLGEVSALVFTAGVGENSPEIRRRILDGMEPLGYELDPQKNAEAIGIAVDIGAPRAPTSILVVPTAEELLIARDTYKIASHQQPFRIS